MIKAIVFDVGGVFLHPIEEQTSKLWNDYGLSDPAVGDHAMYGDELWNVYKRGGMSEEAYWQSLINKLPINYEGSWATFCHLFEHSVELDTELVKIVNDLKQHYPIHALSNAGAELERRLDHFEITNLFGQVINSHYVKMAKPDEAIYTHTSEVIGVSPEEILFVDDKYRNTSVADALGFKTHVYTTAEAFNQFLIEERIRDGEPKPLGK